MKVDLFIQRAKEAVTTKTIYVYGTYGSPLTEALIAYKGNQYPGYNTATRLAKYRGLLGKGYDAWDCVGLIKGILWGWTKTTSPKYAANGVPDQGANTMINNCTGVSTNMNNIVPGEVVWMPGHIGIYIGNGEVVEATPSWKDGVQITKLAGRGWTKHGKLPWIDYSSQLEPKPEPAPSGQIIHTVIKGDSPWSLAVKYLGDGSRYPEIMQLNNLAKNAHITVGQKLKITEGSSSAGTHTVIKGDSPWSLAAKYLGDGNRYPEIMQLNGLAKTAHITVGQVLKIPGKAAPSYTMHTVKRGDTPWALAKKYLGDGNRYTEIMSLNGLAKTADIFAGQELKIPKK